ncbi:hypothetical protein CGRA01v4_07089 [Colletotrichum graminicola]|nr:hypothetical protein CGRA01v4_07089 [Colletotrichum graminicola]
MDTHGPRYVSLRAGQSGTLSSLPTSLARFDLFILQRQRPVQAGTVIVIDSFALPHPYPSHHARFLPHSDTFGRAPPSLHRRSPSYSYSFPFSPFSPFNAYPTPSYRPILFLPPPSNTLSHPSPYLSNMPQSTDMPSSSPPLSTPYYTMYLLNTHLARTSRPLEIQRARSWRYHLSRREVHLTFSPSPQLTTQSLGGTALLRKDVRWAKKQNSTQGSEGTAHVSLWRRRNRSPAHLDVGQLPAAINRFYLIIAVQSLYFLFYLAAKVNQIGPQTCLPLWTWPLQTSNNT